MHKNTFGKPQTLMFTIMGMILLHILKAIVAPPEHLPYLWNYIFAAYGFFFNMYFFMMGNLIILETLNEIISRQKKL